MGKSLIIGSSSRTVFEIKADYFSAPHITKNRSWIKKLCFPGVSGISEKKGGIGSSARLGDLLGRGFEEQGKESEKEQDFFHTGWIEALNIQPKGRKSIKTRKKGIAIFAR